MKALLALSGADILVIACAALLPLMAFVTLPPGRGILGRRHRHGGCWASPRRSSTRCSGTPDVACHGGSHGGASW